MTQEQYEKWSAPIRRKKYGAIFLIGIDKIMAGILFISYPVLLLYLLMNGRIKELLLCTVIPAASFVIVSLFRSVYAQKRPYEVFDIVPLIPKQTKGKSFPSRHVFSVYIIGMTFFYVVKPVGIVIFLSGILMAYIRVAGGVHFPKDVAAGAVIGILCGLLYYLF